MASESFPALKNSIMNFDLLAVGELGFRALFAAAHGVGDLQDFGQGFGIRQEAGQKIAPEFSGNKPEKLKGDGSRQIGAGCKGRQNGMIALGMVGKAGKGLMGKTAPLFLTRVRMTEGSSNSISWSLSAAEIWRRRAIRRSKLTCPVAMTLPRT